MLINKTTKQLLTFSLYPNTNWLNDDENYYLVSDASELGIQIRNLGTLENCTLQTTDGELTSITIGDKVVYYTKAEVDSLIEESLPIWQGTQEEYDALGVYDDNIIYFIKDDTEEE